MSDLCCISIVSKPPMRLTVAISSTRMLRCVSAGRGFKTDYAVGRPVTTTRRDFLTAAVTAAGAAVTPDRSHTHLHDHDHEHQAVPSDPTLRVKALESLLVEKGLVDQIGR